MAEPREKTVFSLDRLLSNPELIAGLLSLFGAGRQTEESRSEELTEPYREGADLSDGTQENTKADLETEAAQEIPTEAEYAGTSDAAEDSTAVAVSGRPSPGGKGRGRKREMLCALKPYMSPGRCEMVDRILHAADLVELFRR